MPEREETVGQKIEGIAAVFTCLFLYIGLMLVSNIGLDPSESRQWVFREDMNGDSRFTIKDVWVIAVWLFFYPGDLLVYFIYHHMPGLAGAFRNFAEFIEVSPIWYGGGFSFLISLVTWHSLCWSLYGIIYSALSMPGDLYKRYLKLKDKRARHNQTNDPS